MASVTGIGGVFFRARDPESLRQWYSDTLGIELEEWGGTVFAWTGPDGEPAGGSTVWSIAPADAEQFAPSQASFMVNYRVDDLDAFLGQLRDAGCEVTGGEDSEFGKFGWVMDPEGNKVELWEPPPGQ